jgi:hypothetical protein
MENHKCTKEYQLNQMEKNIDKHEKIIFGDNVDDGLDKKTDHTRHAIKIWNRNFWFFVIPLCTLIGTVSSWVIIDHYKIQQFDKDYVSKAYINQWLYAIHEEVVIMKKITFTSVDSIAFYREKLDYIEKNTPVYQTMRNYRGK